MLDTDDDANELTTGYTIGSYAIFIYSIDSEAENAFDILLQWILQYFLRPRSVRKRVIYLLSCISFVKTFTFYRTKYIQVWSLFETIANVFPLNRLFEKDEKRRLRSRKRNNEFNPRSTNNEGNNYESKLFVRVYFAEAKMISSNSYHSTQRPHDNQ